MEKALQPVDSSSLDDDKNALGVMRVCRIAEKSDLQLSMAGKKFSTHCPRLMALKSIAGASQFDEDQKDVTAMPTPLLLLSVSSLVVFFMLLMGASLVVDLSRMYFWLPSMVQRLVI